MELRNKNTGERGILALHNRGGEIEIVVLEPDMPLCGNSVIARYNSLAELNAEWEDYTQKEPLIKDKRPRNIVREFLLLNGAWENVTIEFDEDRDVYIFTNGYGLSIELSDVSFTDYNFKNRQFTLQELCGEEE